MEKPGPSYLSDYETAVKEMGVPSLSDRRLRERGFQSISCSYLIM